VAALSGFHSVTSDLLLATAPAAFRGGVRFMELRFVFNSSSGKPRIHSKRVPVLVGRSDAPDIKLRIPKDSISRRHCEFFLDDQGRVCIRDLESTNGTFLDGRQLAPHAATPVPSGRMIKLGDVGFRVEYEADAAGAPAHDGDTIPSEAAAAPVDVEGLGSAVGLAPTEPLGDQASVAAAAPQPAPGDFGFLAGAEEVAAADDAWPQSEDAPAEGDAGLDDFFKGLP
jgi:predicted component of type VI protein secretion system